MSPKLTSVTARQLSEIPDDGKRYELVEGELRMMSPAGGRHGRVAHNLGLILGTHVRQAALGVVYAAETGFLISHDPDTVRAPVIAFVSDARARQIDDDEAYPAIAPDLVGEVVSPSDAFTEVEAKALAWLNAGTQMVLVVDPSTRKLHVYRSSARIAVLDEDATCDASDVVSDWRFDVAELFR